MSRRISSAINNVLINRFQTIANKAKITSIVELKRPYTVLIDDFYLERVGLNIGSDTSVITDTDIAISHPRLGHENEMVYITAINDGVGKVYAATSNHIMKDHRFVDLGYSKPASSVAIGFSAYLDINYRYQQERVTEDPWWFWVNDGVLTGRNLHENQEVIIASGNVTDVAVVSGVWDRNLAFDYGMMVFFIANGSLMVRRLIKGTWYNAEVIGFGPGAPYSSVTATLTWDYRVAITVSKTDGTFHTIFTNFLGFGKTSSELINFQYSRVAVDAIKIQNIKTPVSDKVAMKNSNISMEVIYKGPSKVLRAENVVNSNKNHGTIVRVWFNTFIKQANLVANAPYTTMTDSSGRTFEANTATASTSGRYVDFTFDGFNDAVGDLTIEYYGGRMYNEFDYLVERFSVTFTPTKLNGLPVPRPNELIPMRGNSRIRSVKIRKLRIEPIEKVRLRSRVSIIRTNIKDI